MVRICLERVLQQHHSPFGARFCNPGVLYGNTTQVFSEPIRIAQSMGARGCASRRCPEECWVFRIRGFKVKPLEKPRVGAALARGWHCVCRPHRTRAAVGLRCRFRHHPVDCTTDTHEWGVRQGLHSVGLIHDFFLGGRRSVLSLSAIVTTRAYTVCPALTLLETLPYQLP